MTALDLYRMIVNTPFHLQRGEHRVDKDARMLLLRTDFPGFP